LKTVAANIPQVCTKYYYGKSMCRQKEWSQF